MTTTHADKPVIHRWTGDEYMRLADLGWFAGQRVELVDGRIIHMPPQKDLHVFAVERVRDRLKDAFGPNHWVRAQATLVLGRVAAPDPDVAVVPGPPRPGPSYPTSALLVVEVSDTTLAYDRGRKMRTYARAGVTDYWILNLVDRRLEVHRDPAARPKPRYRSVTHFVSGESVAPLALPSQPIAVSDLLP